MKNEDFEKISCEKVMEFSLEAQKCLFFLNGSAAIALLAFWGNMNEAVRREIWLWIPILLFAFGSVLSVLGMFLTREGRLRYGHGQFKAGGYVNIWATNACFLSFAVFFGACATIVGALYGCCALIITCISLGIVFIVLNITYWNIVKKQKKSRQMKVQNKPAALPPCRSCGS